jgi:DNA-binding transcriptional regulator YdaS (Cro superfamily)
MKLTDYLKLNPRKALAEAIGVNVVYLSHLCSGYRKPSALLANKIEEATGGQVTRQELRPDDYWLIWPELPKAKPKKAPRKRHATSAPAKIAA